MLASCLFAAGTLVSNWGGLLTCLTSDGYLEQLVARRPSQGGLRAAGCATDVRKAASYDHIARAYDSSANGLLQHGHSPSYPLTRAENAVGCGKVVIALNASGAQCA